MPSVLTYTYYQQMLDKVFIESSTAFRLIFG
jgi:hypothetical protein